MNDLVKQLEEFKRGLTEELRLVEQTILEAQARKREIVQALYSLTGNRVDEEASLSGQVLAFIQVSPDGVRRSDIVEGIEFDGNLKYLTNVLGTLRASGKIRREGANKGAVWYPAAHDIE